MQSNDKDIALETAKVLATLESHKELTLRLRFGIGDYAPLTHEEIAEQLGITPEDVAKLEEEALRELRHPSATPRAAGRGRADPGRGSHGGRRVAAERTDPAAAKPRARRPHDPTAFDRRESGGL